MRLKIPAVVFIRKIKCLENTNEEPSPVNVLQWLYEESLGTVWVHILNVYINKYPNNLKLSVLQCKHYTTKRGMCTGDSLKVILGLNDI